jgi:hypothetical protein
MINSLLLSLITALLIIGAHIVTNWEGMLLYFLTNWYERAYAIASERQQRILSFISKPVFTCPYCMSSVWTIVMWFTYGCGPHHWFLVVQIPLTCGIVAVLWGAIQYFKGE